MHNYDLIVVGGGPAGYVAAIRAAQLHLKTAIIEKQALGGTCLNVGCIPTKALYQSAKLVRELGRAQEFGIGSPGATVDLPTVIARKNKIVAQLVGGVKHLMKKNKVDVIQTQAAFADAHTLVGADGTQYTARYLLLATGSHNDLPPVPGIEGRNVIDSTAALSLEQLPDSLVIVGGGVIGVELGNIFASLGSKVTILEMLPQLIRGADPACAEILQRQLEQDGVRVELSAAVQKISDAASGHKAVTFAREGGVQTVEAEYVLVATGRAPNSAGLGLEKAGVKTDARGWIQVDGQMRTNVEHIYAAGDVTGRSFLAHAAYEEGCIAVENMAGHRKQMCFDAIPKAVFASPELGWVGMTEEEARQAGHQPIAGVFPLSANGKALAEGETGGFVKVVSEQAYHRVLGVHMAGPCASEIIAAGASLIAQECGLEDVEATIYPHPSVSEALREACLIALGRAVHS